MRHRLLVIGRWKQVPAAFRRHLHRGVAGEGMTSLIEKPCSIQSDTAKCHMSCQRNLIFSLSQSGLKCRLTVLA
jgi:hypothetical protein